MSGDRVRELFRQSFSSEPKWIASAPGRVNLIGEHTDYNGGFVFPVAIDREVWVAADISDGETQLASEMKGAGEAFDANTVEPGQVSGWSAYVAGMAWALRDKGKLTNLRVAVVSDVPMGSGVSSSAALELAFGVLWNHINGLGISQKDLALRAQRCENGFVGLNCGIMDQMASAMGRDGNAMFLDTRSLDIRYAKIPDGVSIVLCDTKKPRALTDSAYNERRSQCEASAAILGVPQLRDATLEQLEANRAKLDPVVYQRAHHVITEDARCLAFAEALDREELEALAALMKGSHVSLRDDYEVSCPELDRMAEAAQNAPGCLGARMTGAGFGGACVALVRTPLLAEFTDATLAAYAKSGAEIGSAFCVGSVLACQASEGARVH